MTEVERFIELKNKIETLSNEKIRFEERHKNERSKLEALVKEIKKMEPMDDYPIFYSTTLIELLDCGHNIELTALNE